MLFGIISILLLIVSFQQGFLYAIMAFGVYITFRILNLPDLTVDGSFVLGMSVTAVVTIHSHPILALLLSFCVGALAGTVTALLQTKLGVHPILSGILVMTSLYSINLYIMGGVSNLSLFDKETVFTSKSFFKSLDQDLYKTMVGLLIALFIFILLSLFFKTRLGLAIRATGDNEDMVRSSSINANYTKCIALALGNGLVALSGGLISHLHTFADITFGTGIVVIGLASVIIGEAFFGKRSVTIGFLSTLFGSVAYWLIISLALKFDLLPAYTLKLISSFIVVLALLLPKIKEGIAFSQLKRRCK